MTLGMDAIVLCSWFSDGMWEGHSALDAESSKVGYCEVFVLCFISLYISIEYPYFCGN